MVCQLENVLGHSGTEHDSLMFLGQLLGNLQDVVTETHVEHTVSFVQNKEGDFANYLQQIFNVFKYLAPALVIVLSIVEFIKAAASDDKDALMKAGKKTGIRIVLAISLFFIPGLINFLFDKLGWYGTCGIG